ncbi:N-acetylmuramoyl-L-alanine amidase AmiD precursor [Roseivivax sp. THAF40]|uniref:N-acetylmuramoyl-L-alanine amidase n=1 Tax=unclassified Roseivivax TaxID=2639302 RepID=UPI0012684B63|nr:MULTISPECIES: N-acetylmuramoyl-L-alanine amidase [unclassified Roseivivax]QFS83435.1 N-acetylmuramoyl-L-alanine amidase AmiD precursor [Roseivivax sp. THAF197b]QFT47180.1 N-acetylmuramoyl-L-alanine amidase AmiD precursor [Roseivivax sp. THAF40]
MEPGGLPFGARLIPEQHASPNHGPRRDGARPDHVVLHYTAMQSAEAALKRLCLPEAEVSAHYLIAEDGRVWQMVDETARAWHAGAGCWRGISDMNSRSIGIELANTGAQPFAEPQMTALEALLPGIMTRWDIAPEAVIGHSDMALGRKIDPGSRFDWRRLARRGLSIWPDPADPGDFHQDAARFGYHWNAGQEDALLAAFRARFRPGATGPLSDHDRAIMAGLAATWPAAP